MSRIATPDQIIAQNVRRLREERRSFTVTQLAEAMEISRAKVYDYEHRAGRQHTFKWSELIELRTALRCSIFELVLPDRGETVDVPEWVRPVESQKRSTQLGGAARVPMDRDQLADRVFHMPADILDPARLDHLQKRWVERQREAMRELRDEFFQELRDLGAMTPEEYRRYREGNE